MGIARALANNPDILLCDEATSALDPQTTDEVLELLLKINQELNLTVVLITHEMHVIRKICNRVAVMEYGEIVEEGKVIDIFKSLKQKLRNALSNKKRIKHWRNGTGCWRNVGTISEWKIVRLLFHGEQAKLPIISHIVQEYQVEVSIIQGNIQQTKQGAVGSLYIQLLGEEQNILAAIEGLRKLRVETEVIEMNNRGLASFFDFSQIDISKLQEKTIETLYMTGISIIVVAILGLILGLLLLKRQAEKGFWADYCIG